MKKYMYFIRNGNIEIYPMRRSNFSGVITWINKNVHKFFRFKDNQVYDTPEQAKEAGELYLQKKNHNPSLNEINIMKKSQLKPLIKTVLIEIYNRRKLNEWSSGTFEDYVIEFESLVIPGISTENDPVTISVNIEYEADEGSPAKGMFGPPEHSSPAESPEVHILDYSPVNVVVWGPEMGDNKKTYDPNALTPEQQTIVKKAVSNYMDSEEDSVKEKIMDTLGNNVDEPRERDYFEDK